MSLLSHVRSQKIWASLFSFILLLSLAACSDKPIEDKPEIIRPAKIMVVGDPLAGEKRIYPGEVEGSDRSEQAFRVSGELVELPAKAGLRVKKGQLLAKLDPRDFQLSVDELEARYELALVQFNRTDKLVKQQLIPISDFDTAKSNKLAAQADLRLAKANLSYAELRAPFDGIISRLNFKNHENIRKNEVVLVLQTTDNIDITFNLSENVISKLKKESKRNAHPRVVFDTLPNKFYQTTVKEFNSEADDQTRSYQVTLTLPSPKEFNALPGMSVNVYLDFSKLLDNAERKIMIPVEAVFSPEKNKLKNKKHIVWVVDPDSMQTNATQVEIGEINIQGIEIKSGLKTGDQIVIAGVNFIKENQTIKPWIKEDGL